MSDFSAKALLASAKSAANPPINKREVANRACQSCDGHAIHYTLTMNGMKWLCEECAWK